MPKITRPIPEVQESITRPVVLDVVREFFRITGLPTDTSVQYNGNNLQVPQPGSTMDTVYDNYVKFPHSQRLKINVTENFPEESILNTAVMRPEQEYVFWDEANGVSIIPVYRRAEVRIQIELRTSDRPSADRWRNALQTKISRGMAANLHEINYHYPIPLEFVVILLEIQRLKELVEPIGEDIGGYIRRCMTPRFTTIVNPAGKHPTMVIRETQIRTVGYLDPDTVMSQFDRQDSGGSWVTQMEYVHTYDLCTDAYMQYPVIIHNQVLSDTYRPNSYSYNWKETNQTGGVSVKAFRDLTEQNYQSVEGYQGVSVPFYDDWLPKYLPPSTVGLMRLLLSVDLEDKQDLINLSDLGDYSFNDYTLNYMREAGELLLRRESSAFYIELYRGYMPYTGYSLLIDPGLKLRTNKDLNPRDQYHLGIYLNFRIAGITGQGKNLLLKHGEFTVRYLICLTPSIVNDGYLPTVQEDGGITLFDLNKALGYVESKRTGRLENGFIGVNYVGQFVVTAHKEQDYAVGV